MITLDKRLGMVASLVRQGSRVADVGTDHAYLPVYLIQAGVATGAIAADIGEGPLDAARHTVIAAGLESAVSLRLGDGLAPVSADEVDDIVIAGMGGETIVAILNAAIWIKNPHYRLVLQPMSRAEELRRWLLYNGFTITTERLVQDKHHLYPVMVAAYTAAPAPTEELRIYAGFFAQDEGAPYRAMMVQHLCRRAAGAHRAGNLAESRRLMELVELLEKSH